MDAYSGRASNADDAAASQSIAHDGVGGTARPLPSHQLQDPTHPRLPTNDDNIPRDDLYNGTGVRALDAPSIPMPQNTLTAPPLTSGNWSRAPSNHDTSPPTSGFAFHSMAVPPRSLSVAEGQRALMASAVDPTMSMVNPKAIRECWAAVFNWANSETEDDAVALVEAMLHHGCLSPGRLFGLIRSQLAAAQPPVSRAVPQEFPNSSTLNPIATFSESLWLTGIPTPHLSFPSGSWATPSASSPYLNSGFPPSSLSYPSTLSMTPTTAAAISPTLFPNPYHGLGHDAQLPAISPALLPNPYHGLEHDAQLPAISLALLPTLYHGLGHDVQLPAVSPAFSPNLYCEAGHDAHLQTFAVLADTNPSPRTQGPSKSGASSGRSHAAGHAQPPPAVQAAVANALDPWGPVPSLSSYPGPSPSLSTSTHPSMQNWKSGNCFQCGATRASQWRRHRKTREQICTVCYHKHKKQQEREQESHDACAVGFS
jgi:hypothetical protein